MSYGDELTAAASALARAHVALRDPPPDPPNRAGAAVARARLYRSLERQIVALGGVHGADLPQLGSPSVPRFRSITTGNPVMDLAVGLRYARAETVAANPGEQIDSPAVGVVGGALRDAYLALQTGGDILISNTGARVGPGEDHQPLTSDGVALLAGFGRGDNLAALARLAAAAAAMDARMARWMWPEEAPTELRRLLSAAEQDAWQTKSSRLHEMALALVRMGDGTHAPVLGLTVAPPVDDARRWAQPTSLADCVEAMDAARSWLTRHGDQLTVGQLAATARAALAITHYLGHVQMHLCPAGDDLTEAVVAAARPWRGVLQAVTELRSPVLAQADHSTLSVAATGVASWLRAQVRPDGHWRTPSPWAGDPTSAGAWRAAAEQITARMPDLANLLRQAIAAVHARGGVLAATGRLNPRSASLVHHPEWVPAPHDHRSYRALHKALTNSAARGLELVTAVGVAPHPGHDPARRHATTPISAAQLARAWYPQAGGIAEHALEPARGSMRSAASRAPDRRRTR